MSLWVASLGLAVGLTLSVQAVIQNPPSAHLPLIFVQLRQQPTQEEPGYRTALLSTVRLNFHGVETGSAVLVDSGGLYLAQKLSVPNDEVEGTFPNGQVGHLKLIGRDGCSSYVLLRSDYVPSNARTVTLPNSEPDPGTPLVVILNGGAVGARLVSSDRIGVIRPSSRLIPLNEIQFEMPAGSLAGALVFTRAGDFLGVLSATLTHEQAPNQFGTRGGFGAPGRFGGAAAPRLNAAPLLPADLAVAYTAGLDVLRGVVEGFLAPDHQVIHGSLGVFCRDGSRGALITAVQDNSAAEQAGLAPNDLILSMGVYRSQDRLVLYRIHNQIDFAKFMFRQKAGDRITIGVDRDGRSITRTATLKPLTD
jgi:S1-C subfamily serine protease